MDGKLVFIGGGNMAEGIFRGLIEKNSVKPEQMYVYDINGKRMEYLEKTYQINVVGQMEKAAELADFLVLAVRPQDVEDVARKVKNVITKDTVVVSICAGITLEKLSTELGSQCKLVRTMPNTLGETGRGFSALCANDYVLEGEKEVVTMILDAIGKTLFIKEDDFDIFTAFSCTGPAYLLYTIDALIDAGVHAGFSRADARSIVIENMSGVAKKLEITGAHPKEVIETMTSPAGVTIEAVCHLDGNGVAGAMQSSVATAVKRAHELA